MRMSIIAIPLMPTTIVVIGPQGVVYSDENIFAVNFFQSVKMLYETFDITDIDIHGPLSYITERAYEIEKVLPYEDDYNIWIMADDEKTSKQRIQDEATNQMQKMLGQPGQIIKY